MNLLKQLLLSFWLNEERYLAGRILELHAEQREIAKTIVEAEYRLARARTRLVQYGRVA